jgi:hypothetical protein
MLNDSTEFAAKMTLSLFSDGKHVHRRRYRIPTRSTPASEPKVIRLAAHIRPAKKRELHPSWIARERQEYFARVDRKFGRLPAEYWSQRELRAELEILVAEYLAKGGKIQKILTDKSGLNGKAPQFIYGSVARKSNSLRFQQIEQEIRSLGGDLKPPKEKGFPKGKSSIGSEEGLSGLRNRAPTLDQTEGSFGYEKKALDRGLKLASHYKKDENSYDFIKQNK